MSKKLTQAEFLVKAVAAHGAGRYDYSQVVYAGHSELVAICCPAHGLFKQAANSHLAGRGCAACGRAQSAVARFGGAADFLAKARAKHGSKYDYSQMTHGDRRQSEVIICPEHGPFMQRPDIHLRGSGCAACGRQSQGKQKMGLTDFLAKARAKHGSKYDYSQAACENSTSKVRIGCPAHGPFEQVAASHVAGKGCALCAIARATARQTNSQGKFLARAHAAHGTRYDYSQAVYTKGKDKVRISCPIHGLFEQEANAHTLGHGCPLCGFAETRLSWIESAAGRTCTLYFLRLFGNAECFYKVGITARSIRQRFAHALPYQYEVLATHSSTNAAAVFEWEQSILETFACLHYRPKLHFDGQSECFSSCEEILAIFPL